VTLCDFSAVVIFNQLKMSNIKFNILTFTALTPIFALCLGLEKSGLN
jgi:hypothetical protein